MIVMFFPKHYDHFSESVIHCLSAGFKKYSFSEQNPPKCSFFLLRKKELHSFCRFSIYTNSCRKIFIKASQTCEILSEIVIQAHTKYLIGSAVNIGTGYSGCIIIGRSLGIITIFSPEISYIQTQPFIKMNTCPSSQ